MEFTPKFKQICAEISNVRFAMVDCDANPDARESAEVTEYPTFMIFKNAETLNKVKTTNVDELKYFI